LVRRILTDVSSYRAETEVPWFKSRVKCGGRGNKIDVLLNWKVQPVMPTRLRFEWARRGPLRVSP
jgi:hypothetical protein